MKAGVIYSLLKPLLTYVHEVHKRTQQWNYPVANSYIVLIMHYLTKELSFPNTIIRVQRIGKWIIHKSNSDVHRGFSSSKNPGTLTQTFIRNNFITFFMDLWLKKTRFFSPLCNYVEGFGPITLCMQCHEGVFRSAW